MVFCPPLDYFGNKLVKHVHRGAGGGHTKSKVFAECSLVRCSTNSARVSARFGICHGVVSIANVYIYRGQNLQFALLCFSSLPVSLLIPALRGLSQNLQYWPLGKHPDIHSTKKCWLRTNLAGLCNKELLPSDLP